MAQDIWNKFEYDLKSFDDNVDDAIINKLKKIFMTLPFDYINSEDYDLIFKDTISKISNDKKKLYIYLLALKISLKELVKMKESCVIESVADVKEIVVKSKETLTVISSSNCKNGKITDYYNNYTTSLKSIDKNEVLSPVDKRRCSLVPVKDDTKKKLYKNVNLVDNFSSTSQHKGKITNYFNFHMTSSDETDVKITNSKRRCTLEAIVDVKKRKVDDHGHLSDNLSAASNSHTTESGDEIIEEKQKKINKYISRLEGVLQSTKLEIEKLEEEEWTLDDLAKENNSYILLDRLKSHSVKVWRKICKLKNSKSRLHRRNLRLFSFKGTVYPDLNLIIENCVKTQKFPDYNDIKLLVHNFVIDKSINMNSRKILELAIDIFTQVGNKLKKLRIREFTNYFGSHLTDQVKANENPILSDCNLKKVLMCNYEVGQTKLDEIFDKYSKIDQGIEGKDEENESNNSSEDGVDSVTEDIEYSSEETILEAVLNKKKLESYGKTIPKDEYLPKSIDEKVIVSDENNVTESLAFINDVQKSNANDNLSMNELVTSKASSKKINEHIIINKNTYEAKITVQDKDITENPQNEINKNRQIDQPKETNQNKENNQVIGELNYIDNYTAISMINNQQKSVIEYTKETSDNAFNFDVGILNSNILIPSCPMLSLSQNLNNSFRDQTFSRSAKKEKCHTYDYCVLPEHNEPSACHYAMSIYYGGRCKRQSVFVCPTCMSVQEIDYLSFFIEHKPHLGQFYGISKKKMLTNEKYRVSKPQVEVITISDDELSSMNGTDQRCTLDLVSRPLVHDRVSQPVSTCLQYGPVSEHFNGQE